MIRTNNEYEQSVATLTEFKSRLDAKKQALAEMGLAEEEIQRLTDPEVAFYSQIQDEVASYDRLRRRDAKELERYSQFSDFGKLLIALRIFSGKSQSELASALNVDPSQVCRDERNEYQGITLARAVKLLNVMSVPLRVQYGDSSSSVENVAALEYV